jgi:hypothetical protein
LERSYGEVYWLGGGTELLTRNLRGAEVRHDLDSGELMSSRKKSYASCRRLGFDDLPVFVGLGNQYSCPLVGVLLDKEWIEVFLIPSNTFELAGSLEQQGTKFYKLSLGNIVHNIGLGMVMID